MAVVTLKSGAITNRDSSPVVLSNASIANTKLQEAVGYVETGAADDIGSVYIFASIPSNARVSQLLLYSDDIGTSGTADFGIYQTTALGGAVVDADFFASAVVMSGGALNGSDITHESGVFNIDDSEKPLWQALGLTSDPNRMYDVAATLTAATDAAASVVVKVKYGI